MLRFRPYTAIVPAIAALSVLTASCGNQKLVQCKSLLDIVNQTTSQPASANPKPEETIQQATQVEQKAQTIKALAVKDPKLQELQSRFSQLYTEESNALKNAAQAAIAAEKAADGQAKIDALTKSSDLYLKVTDVYNKQLDVINEVSEYCSK